MANLLPEGLSRPAREGCRLPDYKTYNSEIKGQSDQEGVNAAQGVPSGFPDVRQQASRGRLSVTNTPLNELQGEVEPGRR